MSILIKANVNGKIINVIPTHCKFKTLKDARFWGCTNKQWLQIGEISGDKVSTIDFAWVDKSQLIFKIDEPYFCKQCKDELVLLPGGICVTCEFDNNLEEIN
jgi:hypothetical protein